MVLQGSRSVSDYQCSFVPVVFSSVVQFDLGLFFKSIKINSLLTSPICCACGKWSWKKSEYFKPS